MKVVTYIAATLFALAVIVGVGLRITPAAFPAFSAQQPNVDTIPLPEGLPAPVERFYRVTYGDSIPVLRSVVISGRGWMRFFNLKTPIRFRFAHEVGKSFRHDIHLTLYGLPFLKGFETYIDGQGWANTPGFQEGEGFNQGSNISLWAEALNWFPAALLTDPRVEWKPVDDVTAVLSVPFEERKESLIVRFDPQSGKILTIEAMKYKAAVGKKVLWTNGVWFDEGRPWIQLNVEDLLYNSDVNVYLHAPRP